jgi:hypothetical protein
MNVRRDKEANTDAKRKKVLGIQRDQSAAIKGLRRVIRSVQYQCHVESGNGKECQHGFMPIHYGGIDNREVGIENGKCE